ncbi:response regulator [Bacillus infantis]|uniref:response regulator n=1 Tax=Bacillus infantis TaxID=324767 RepID=UPI001CD77083|nr:response regulator [Bacillus infantis]MCA1042514.1 response regulator [Bacillus infantis]
MYKLLIVDDEQLVIDGLSAAIDWEEHHITITATASDGEEAFEKIISLEPDIVLADIRIPKMNGLDLIHKVRSHRPETYFIVISGYSEFEYAKRAIELEAIDYLVKPIQAEEILKSVEKAISKYDKRKEEKQIDVKLKHYQDEQEEKYILDCILGNRLDPSSVRIKQFCVMGIRVDSLDWGDPVQKGRIESVLGAIKEKMKMCGADSYLYIIDGLIVIMLLPAAQQPDELLYQDISAFISQELQAAVFLGVSRMHEGASNLNKAYSEAMKALNIGNYTDSPITEYENLKETDAWIESMLLQEIETFFKSQKANVLSDIDSLMGKIMENSKEGSLPPEKVRYICFEVVSHVIDYIEQEYEVKAIGTERHVLFDELNALSSLEKIRSWFTQLISRIKGYLDENKISHNDKLILDVKTYLKSNYSEPIVLDDLGRKFHKNAAYLCSLFSKAENQTIIEYITSVRMGEAKKLLRSTNYKVSQICTLVGYENQKYFNQVFKKNTGTTPGTYRSMHIIK